MKSDAEQVGSRIRQLRESAGLTQEALGSAINLTRTSINNIEHGRQQLVVGKFLEISRALRVRPEDLLNFEGEPLPADVSRFISKVAK